MLLLDGKKVDSSDVIFGIAKFTKDISPHLNVMYNGECYYYIGHPFDQGRWRREFTPFTENWFIPEPIEELLKRPLQGKKFLLYHLILMDNA